MIESEIVNCKANLKEKNCRVSRKVYFASAVSWICDRDPILLRRKTWVQKNIIARYSDFCNLEKRYFFSIL